MKTRFWMVVLIGVLAALLAVSCRTQEPDRAEFRQRGEVLEWKYASEGEDAWRELARLDASGRDGADGKDGENGADGKDGVNGQSAYELYRAVHPEYTGSEAQWLDDLINGRLGTPARYTVTFDTAGGEEIPPQAVRFGMRAVAPVAKRDGYEFVCWRLQGEPWQFVLPVMEDLTLTAEWRPCTYRLIYNLDGGTNAAENPATYTVSDAAVPLAEPARDGYRFLGWELDGALVHELPAGVWGNLTLTAKWERITFLYGLKADGTYEITGYQGDDRIVVIPDSYDGKPVTGIAPRAFYGKLIVSLTVPATVTEIGEFAFFGCCQLVELINYSSLPLDSAPGSAYGYVNLWLLSYRTEGKSRIRTEGDFWFLPLDGVEYLVCYSGNAETIRLPTWADGRTYVMNTFCIWYVLTARSIVLSESVSDLREMAIAECENLEWMVISRSVRFIGDEVLRGSLRLSNNGSLFYAGSAEDWNRIGIVTDGEGNYWLLDAKRYYYSETEPETAGDFWHWDASGIPAIWKTGAGT